MYLLIDNYDSFTYNLLDYFAQLGVSCKVVRNNACTLSDINALNPEGIIISPGPETPEKSGITIPVIRSFHQKVPILGICLGHQAIGQYFGAKLVLAKQPIHGYTSALVHHNHPMFYNIPQHTPVMRYHSLVLTEVTNTPLEITATTVEGEIMAIAHQHLPIYGVQFHPESILTHEGLNILNNCLNLMSNP
ncbi:MAG: aminodeoxychorismate/anthranilate synthase component II [Sphingobacteriales bacterium]|nr:MAG: aminodeoxychorismate/anthranilate synthase component II [Sphingobacteriales bacterium]